MSLALPATTVSSFTNVFEDNFLTESLNLETTLQKFGRNRITVSFDNEFPGTVSGGYTPGATPEDSYKILKDNVNNTEIIQLGLTLKNPNNGGCHVWSFNFKDFNLSRGDLHDPGSIKLLKQQGIDFDKNAKDGIDSKRFGKFLKLSGLLLPNRVSWIGFHTPYDLGYMLKMLTGNPLPEKLCLFHSFVNTYFGSHQIYDLKYVVKSLPNEAGLHGGLNKIAKTLGVDRAAGRCHQAGSDSLLIMQTYEAVLNKFFYGQSLGYGYCSRLFGLEIMTPIPNHYYGYHSCNSAPGYYLPQAIMPRNRFHLNYGY